MAMADRTHTNRAVFFLMLAVGAWGGLLALGALLFGYRDEGGVGLSIDVRRGLIVLACVAGFLGVWGSAMWLRARRSNSAK